MSQKLNIQAIKAAARAERAALNAKLPRTPQQVVFVSDIPGMRQIKLAAALRHVGWETILLHQEPLHFDATKYFAKVHSYRDLSEALSFASWYTPIAYHVFSNWAFETSAVFMRYKPGKIVFDNYDLLTGMTKPERTNPQQLALEQYCLTHSDGLCCRGLHTQHLKRHMGYRLPKRILFPEYCWANENPIRQQKLTDGIHVAYAANIDIDPDSPVGFQYDLAALLSKNNIHFHIYPTFSKTAAELRPRMAQYLENHGDPRFVHLHDTVPPDALIDELSKYHYGVIISTKKVDYYDDHSTYYSHMSDYIVANKIFDYLDAGLFTFTQKGRSPQFLTERYHNGKVVRSLEDIVTYCKNASFTLPIIPDTLKLMKNAHRLANFYTSLLMIP